MTVACITATAAADPSSSPWAFGAHAGYATSSRDGYDANEWIGMPVSTSGFAVDASAGHRIGRQTALVLELGYQQTVARYDAGWSDFTYRHLSLAPLIEWRPILPVSLAAGAGLAVEADGDTIYRPDPSFYGRTTTWRVGAVLVARAGVEVWTTRRWHAELSGEFRWVKLDDMGAGGVAETGTTFIAGLGVRYR
jgi:hypothetical protein